MIAEFSDPPQSLQGMAVQNSYDNNNPVHAVKSAVVNGNTYGYTYDANGNMTQGPDFTDPADVASRSIMYNAYNMPTEIVHSTPGLSHFKYDGNGQRCTKITETAEDTSYTHYVGPHYEIRNGMKTRYIFAGSTRIAMETAFDPIDPSVYDIYYFHKDHLGSSSILTAETVDGPEDVIETTEYLPYGSIRSQSGTSHSNYRYTDQEHDPERGCITIMPGCMIRWWGCLFRRIVLCRITLIRRP